MENGFLALLLGVLLGLFLGVLCACVYVLPVWAWTAEFTDQMAAVLRTGAAVGGVAGAFFGTWLAAQT